MWGLSGMVQSISESEPWPLSAVGHEADAEVSAGGFQKLLVYILALRCPSSCVAVTVDCWFQPPACVRVLQGVEQAGKTGPSRCHYQ